VAFTTSNGKTQSSLADINITPLVDVVLVLLVIFKITAPVLQSGIEVNVPIAPIYTPHTVQQDPQFLDRMEWFPADVLGADQLPFPVKVAGEEPLVPTKAPEVGEHTDAVLRDVLGYDDAKIAALRESGAIT